MDDQEFQRKLQEAKQFKKELDRAKANSPVSRVMSAISDLTGEVQKLNDKETVVNIDVGGLKRTMKSLAEEVKNIEPPVIPDTSDKIIEGINEKISELNKTVSKLDKSIAGMEIKVEAPKPPKVKIPRPEAPIVNVPEVDLRPIHKTLQKDLPKLIRELTDAIPAPDNSATEKELAEIRKVLKEIKDKPTPIPPSISSVGIRYQGTEVSDDNPLPVDATVSVDTTGLATEAKQLPDNHQVTVSNQIDQPIEEGGRVFVDSEDFVKKTVTAASSGDNTVHTPASGKKVRLYFFGYSAGANVDGVLAKLKFGTSADFDQQYLIAPGQPYARNIQAGKRYIDGGVDEPLVINLSAAQTVYVNIELEEI